MITVTRGGVLASVGVLLVVLLCVRLGFWQLDRLEQKRARNATAHARLAEPPVRLTSVARDTAGLIFRRAIVSGVYDDDRTVIVASRSQRGVPGVYVLTPLRIGSSAVLVNRGFMPSADAYNVDLTQIREPSPVSSEGLIVYLGNEKRAAADTATAFRRVWHRPSLPQLRPHFPYPIAGYVVQLLPARNDPEFPLRLEPPKLDEGPHLGYAIQWFSFAVIGVLGWTVMALRKKKGGL